ncbi:hypothetical protein AB0P19_02225 [Microbacterium oleivorans]
MTPDDLTAWSFAALAAFASIALAVVLTVAIVVGIRHVWRQR